MTDQNKKVALQVVTFAAIFGLMCLFMDMMEETEEQITYSVTLERLALGNGEADGENGGGGSTSGESDDPVWGGLSNLLIGQGLYKDEREWERDCPTHEQEGPSVTIGIGRNGALGITSNGPSSRTYPSGRKEITCPNGSTNCSTVDC